MVVCRCYDIDGKDANGMDTEDALCLMHRVMESAEG